MRAYQNFDDERREPAASRGGDDAMATIHLVNDTVQEDTDERSEKHILTRTRLMASSLSMAQMVCAFSLLAFLSDPKTRTGWAQTLGAIAAVVCGFDAAAHVAARAANHLTVKLDILSSAVCLVSFIGLVGLITNAEDSCHDDPIDAIEAAASLFAIAWAASLARLVLCAAEREAREQCTFELRVT